MKDVITAEEQRIIRELITRLSDTSVPSALCLVSQNKRKLLRSLKELNKSLEQVSDLSYESLRKETRDKIKL
jgi:hypothetical protein